KGLAVGTAFADRKRARAPGFRDEPGPGDRQGQRKYKQRAASRDGSRNDQNPLPRGQSGANLLGRTFQLGEQGVENRECRVGKASACPPSCGVLVDTALARLCLPCK